MVIPGEVAHVIETVRARQGGHGEKDSDPFSQSSELVAGGQPMALIVIS
jgi:hypothetical protein